jgi:hypothetical protein|tara:strand:+ start:258 stop:635 length:378 start_codon:yes stop_codon:yes gene_type:complete
VIVANFFETTARNDAGTEGHKLRVSQDGGALSTILVTESLVFAIGVPIVMGLIMTVILVERVIQVTIKPVGLRNNTQIEGHLGIIVCLVVVTGSDGVNLLIKIRMDKLVSKIVVWLLPHILREVR